MSEIILPRRFKGQPQYAAPLDKSHPLAKDVTLFLNGAVPYYNAATGQPLAITGGGSGFSLRATPLGISLYTPNGGWAGVPISQDWSTGPNTVIAVCRVNGIDSPWGGLFSKNAFGVSTQFAVGRTDTTSSLYGSVDDSTAVSFGGVSISSLTDFGVLAFTHSGAASAPMSYYRNGALVGATSALAAPTAGAGLLYLGVARNLDASFDSDVDWIAFVRVARVLSASEIASIASGPSAVWSLLQAPPRRLWAVPAGGGSAGTSSGSAVVTGVGASIASSVGASSGVGAASGVGASTASTAGSSAGVATVSGVGTSSTGSLGSSSGTSTVNGVGSSTAASVGSSNGTASVSGSGASTASTVGSSAGVATVSGVGDSSQAGSSIGSALGSSSVSGVGASVAASVGLASGASSASGVSPAPVSTGGHYAGVAYTGKRPKRDLIDRDREDIKQLIRGQLKEVRAEIIKAEVPQEVKEQARAVIKPLQQSIDVQALQNEIVRVRQMLHMWEQQVKREREEDEELLFLFH